MQASECPLPRETYRTTLVHPAVGYNSKYEVLSTRSSIGTQGPRFLWEAGHVNTLCLPHAKLPDS